MNAILEYLNKLQPKSHIGHSLMDGLTEFRRESRLGKLDGAQPRSSSGKSEKSGKLDKLEKTAADGHPARVPDTTAHGRQGPAGKGHRRIGPDAGPGSIAGSESDAGSEAKRGRFDAMQYIHGFIGCMLVLMALIHVPFPDPLEWVPYAAAASLAFLTLSQNLSMGISRILAIGTAGLMFFFFALFFLLVPRLEADWYTTQFGWAAVCRILAAFLMIPILSDYSCRLKKDCMEAREARRSAFFSVPSNIRPEGR